MNLSKNFAFRKGFVVNKYYGILSLERFSSTNNATSTRKPSYVHHIGKDPLVYENIGQTFDQAVEKFGDRECIVSCHENQRFTFQSIRNKIDQLSAGLLKIGLERGDRVGIWAPNNIQWYLSMIALSRSGLISVGINPFFQGPEVEYCLNKVGIKAIIAPDSFRTQKYYEILEEMCPEIKDYQPGKLKLKRFPNLQSIIIDTDNQLPGTFKFNDIFDLPDRDEVAKIGKNQSIIRPDSACNIQFTSGTTGQPKAAVLSHFGFVNNGIHIGNRNELSVKHQRICVQVPLFHAYGVVISIMTAMTHGATLVLPADGYNSELSLRAIVEEKCTVIHGTPTMYVDLINQQKKLQLPLTTAEIAVTGGSPCSPQLFKDIKNVLGLRLVKTVFGMTENSAVSFQSWPNESEETVLHTVGHLTDHIEAKVVDKDGEMVPFGEPGELWIRGYFMMLGYYEDEEKTRETIGTDKWLRTGDQFILEENGYGRIVGRLKEMIIRGGENIFPKEIEDFLNSHPDIMENFVIGVPDERLGEEVCVFVRLREGVDNLEQSDIKNYCKGKIAHFKVPKYVRIVKTFPKTTSGKIQKFKLKEIFNNKNN